MGLLEQFGEHVFPQDSRDYFSHKLNGYDSFNPWANDKFYERQEELRKLDEAKPFYEQQNWFRQWSPVTEPDGYKYRNHGKGLLDY